MDQVTLDLDLTCIVGILPRERVHPQELRCSLQMHLDLTPTATAGDLAASVNYADADAMVRHLAGEGHFLLIETMALAALRWLLAPVGPGEARAPLQRASIHLTKPDVMPRALPGVRLERTAAQVQVPATELAEGVRERVLCDLDEVRASRVEVDEGARFVPPEGADVAFGDGVGPCTLLVVERRG
jgi:dihydroneopterin aldolase